ncbi:hypothetical protein [Microvirga massiliensis]|uniref:hypothetical protein n=1 Tax=Microvirga massiliensis TaxID=1033741 RepID=UPI00069A2BCC|nr:hypothetical protein [Microvirga massiliensis]
MKVFIYTWGYNGTGIARASWFGHKIAQRALGITEEPSAYADLPFRSGPLTTASPGSFSWPCFSTECWIAGISADDRTATILRLLSRYG